MTNLLTQAQVTALAKAHGFTTAQSVIAGAIAMAETGVSVGTRQYCDADRVGDQDLVTSKWWYSYGPWQVRSLRADKGTGRVRDELLLPGPVFNATSAHTIFTQLGFEAWSTYNNQAYKGYLQTMFPTPAGTYRVTGGDSLSKIGARFGYRWQDIALVNSIAAPRYTIFVGQVLLLPDFPYEVVDGDNLSTIVARYDSGQTVAYVATYNHLVAPYTLAVGQMLKLPRIIPPIALA